MTRPLKHAKLQVGKTLVKPDISSQLGGSPLSVEHVKALPIRAHGNRLLMSKFLDFALEALPTHSLYLNLEDLIKTTYQDFLEWLNSSSFFQAKVPFSEFILVENFLSLPDFLPIKNRLLWWAKRQWDHSVTGITSLKLKRDCKKVCIHVGPTGCPSRVS